MSDSRIVHFFLQRAQPNNYNELIDLAEHEFKDFTRQTIEDIAQLVFTQKWREWEAKGLGRYYTERAVRPSRIKSESYPVRTSRRQGTASSPVRG